MQSKPFFTLFTLLILTACVGTETPAPDVVVAASIEETTPAPEIAEVVTPEESEALPPAPHELMGLSPRHIQETLGEPNLVRRDNAVQIMLYEQPACVLEVIFREPQNAQPFEAVYITARTDKGAEIDTGACITSLYNADE